MSIWSVWEAVATFWAPFARSGSKGFTEDYSSHSVHGEAWFHVVVEEQNPHKDWNI